MSQTAEVMNAQNQTCTEPPAERKRHSQLRRVIVGVLTVAALVLVWEEFVKYRVIAKRWGVVVPGQIYRSGQITKWVFPRKMQEHDIEVVVDLTNFVPNDMHQQAEIATLKRLGIEHHRYRLTGDGTGDIRNYANAVRMNYNLA